MTTTTQATVGIICSPESLRKVYADRTMTLKIHNLIIKLYKNGYRYFISGLERGYAMRVMDEVQALKSMPDYQQIVMQAFLSTENQTGSYGIGALGMFEDLLENMDEVYICSKPGTRSARLTRDKQILDFCSTVLYHMANGDEQVQEVLKLAKTKGIKLICIDTLPTLK